MNSYSSCAVQVIDNDISNIIIKIPCSGHKVAESVVRSLNSIFHNYTVKISNPPLLTHSTPDRSHTINICKLEAELEQDLF